MDEVGVAGAASLPTVRALDSLWFDTTAKPLWLPKTLLPYLRLRRRLDLAPVQRHQANVTLPKGALPNCKACRDICCVGRRNQVTLRLVDIATLLDIGRADLISTEWPSRDASHEAQTSAQRRFYRSQTHALFPTLKQDKSERCLALSEHNRCTLHPHWPLSCARFPYSLDRDDNEVFYSSRCGSAQMYEGSEALQRCEVMIDATLNAYNHRIRDFVLLELQRPALDRLALTQYLRLT